MNEAELVAGTIKAVKDKGWTTTLLYREETNQHCVLGSIGYARWGAQWDIDCSLHENTDEMYDRLNGDPLTRSLIEKMNNVVLALDESFGWENWTPNSVVYSWNDDQEEVEDILEVLEKVQAEIGLHV